MSSIKINNSTIYFDSSFDAQDKDKSWILALNEIIGIGLINKMDSDDDSDFLLFLDRKLNKYFLSLTKDIIGWDSTQSELKQYFNIDLSVKVIDSAIVLYPKEIFNRPLYKKSILTRVKTVLAIVHIASGELSDEVTKVLLKADALINTN